jgi:hypothetical protein
MRRRVKKHYRRGKLRSPRRSMYKKRRGGRFQYAVWGIRRGHRKPGHLKSGFKKKRNAKKFATAVKRRGDFKRVVVRRYPTR